jgi:hypothetical protein
LEAAESQRSGPIVADQEINRGVAKITDAVEDHGRWLVHVDNASVVT